MKQLKHFADSHIHFRDYGEGKIEKMLDNFLPLGLTHVSLYSLPYRSVAEDIVALYTKTTYKKLSVRAFGGLHYCDRYADIPFERQVEGLLKLGCDGIKIMCSPDLRRFVGFGLDDTRYNKMFSMLNELKTPVNIHLADPRSFWDDGQVYGDGSFLTYEQHYTEIFKVLDKYPNLKITFAHFMFLSDDPDEAARVLDKYPNVYFDLTPGTEMYFNFSEKPEFWHDFFTKYSDRMIFGTDSNTIKNCNLQLNRLVYRTLTENHDIFTERCYGRDFNVRGLALSDEVVNKICFENYIRFVGDNMKNVDIRLLRECCERIIADTDMNLIDAHYEASFDLIPYHREDPYQQTAVDFCKKVLLEI